MRIPFQVPAASAKPFDVAGFGLNSIDLIAVVAEHPAPGTKQRFQRFARRPGGQIATAVADGDIEEVLRYANAAAALNCRALGSRGALPTAGEVEQLMSGRVTFR